MLLHNERERERERERLKEKKSSMTVLTKIGKAIAIYKDMRERESIEESREFWGAFTTIGCNGNQRCKKGVKLGV